jgi:hypothetical protein
MAAATANTAAGSLAASSAAAASGPPSVATESSMPRTTFALVSCSGVHKAGSSAECAGRKSVGGDRGHDHKAVHGVERAADGQQQ